MSAQWISELIVKKVISVNRLKNSPVGITIHRKNRTNWGVVLKVEGRTVYTVNGEQIVSDSLHPVLLPQGADYSWKCTQPGECLIVDFAAEATEATLTSVEIKDNSVLINGFAKIEKSLNKQKPYYRLECYSQLYEMLLFLAKSGTKESTHPAKNKILLPAIRHIAENYFSGSITNTSLAALCGISTVYFRKTFESVYGVSPIKYLHNFRINKAKAILLSDYESIEQVALSVGYNSIYHFSKMFKLYTGRNPTEYAKASRR